MHNLWLLCLILLTTNVKADIWETIFPVTPYKSSNKALKEIKKVYKYAIKCTSTPPPDDYYPTKSYSSPAPGCKKFHNLNKNFMKKYEISSKEIKSKEVEYYRKKINWAWSHID